MPYRFATENQDFSDYSGGRVIYSQPGLPAFPVRLASEIFQRARDLLKPGHRLRLYDPACGGAYHLAALGFLHGKEIEAILASDLDEQALSLARRNLGLLSANGLHQREQEIRRMMAEFGKPSHAEALNSLAALRQQLAAAQPIATRVFQANALEGSSIQRGLEQQQVDLVISDIPYGQLSEWVLPESAADAPGSPVEQMLESLSRVLQGGTLAAIAADKSQKVRHPAYRRIEHFQVGKRQVTFLQLQ